MRGPLVPHGHGKPLSKEVRILRSDPFRWCCAVPQELDGLRVELQAIKKDISSHSFTWFYKCGKRLLIVTPCVLDLKLLAILNMFESIKYFTSKLSCFEEFGMVEPERAFMDEKGVEWRQGPLVFSCWDLFLD